MRLIVNYMELSDATTGMTQYSQYWLCRT